MTKKSIFFGAAIVVVIMVSSAAFGVATQLKDCSKSSVSSNMAYVEPGIYLSGSEQRKILSDCLGYIDNPNARVLIQTIVDMMSSKGFVNSNDIEMIVSEYHLEFSFISGIGASITTGAYPNPGYVMRAGHPLQNSGTVLFGLLFWSAKHSSNPAREINITITLSGAQQHIVDDKAGLCVGFSGSFARGEEETGKWFTIQGSALMHLVY